jgi:hypothetical protein
MKKLLFVFLTLGLVEIFYGLLWGRLQIYKFEIPMIRALELTPNQYKAFGECITVFKNQWRVVAIFGVVNVIASILALIWTWEKNVPSK